MHIYKTNFNGNPNVGLYMYVTDKYCLIGKDVPEKHFKMIEEVLKVPIHRISIAGTSLLGALLAGNDNCLLVPETVYEDELKVLDELNIKYKVVDSYLTALGNNMLCNNDGAIVNPEFDLKTRNVMKKALGVPVKKIEIAGIEIVGSLGAMNTTALIIHKDILDKNIKIIEKHLNIKVYKGTVNLGSPYINSGLVCNSNGFLIGDLTGGPEAVDIDENLGFLR